MKKYIALVICVSTIMCSIPFSTFAVFSDKIEAENYIFSDEIVETFNDASHGDLAEMGILMLLIQK